MGVQLEYIQMRGLCILAASNFVKVLALGCQLGAKL